MIYRVKDLHDPFPHLPPTTAIHFIFPWKHFKLCKNLVSRNSTFVASEKIWLTATTLMTHQISNAFNECISRTSCTITYWKASKGKKYHFKAPYIHHLVRRKLKQCKSYSMLRYELGIIISTYFRFRKSLMPNIIQWGLPSMFTLIFSFNDQFIQIPIFEIFKYTKS